MAMDGSDSHGDGDTLPQYYFGPDFKEYVLKEQLKWSRYKENFGRNSTYDQWVFWSEQDHEIEPSPSLDNCAHFNLNVCAIPKVRDNIIRALQKLLESPPILLNGSLVQFWAATKTSEGRTLLTTRYEPFAFALTEASDPLAVRLCNYRMEMCRKYNNCFYADAESGEEQLGLPGRVFLHQFPESTPYVKCYSTKEYPQRDLALRCNIKASRTVPVFEHSSQTCVGVLEIVSWWDGYWFGRDEIFSDRFLLNKVEQIFQEFGLQCFIGDQACKRRVNAYQAHEDELRTALRSVCKFHKLPLAMIWVPCSACDGLRQLEVEFCSVISRNRAMFLQASELSHFRKGLVFRRALSSLNMLYCSNISKLSLDEYPLVPYARLCKYRGWFTICLQNVYTGNGIYVLEFFLSTGSKDSEKILTTLSYILGTIEEKFTTFRLASGQSLGGEMFVELIRFQNNQKFQSVERIQATRDFSMSSIPSSVQSSASVAYTGPGFQGKYDPNSNPISNFDLSFDSDSDPSFEESSTSVANTRPGFQNANMVIIIAKYASIEEVFELSLPCRLVELQQEVTDRLMLEAGTYSAIYEDEEDGPILIACDDDWQTCLKDSMSQGNTPRVVRLELKEPATNLNPTN